MYQTLFSSSHVDTKEIATLAEWLAKKTGAQVKVEQMIVVTTDHTEVSLVMDQLRSSLKNGNDSKRRMPKAAKQAKGKKEPTVKMGPRFWRIEATGEILSRQKLNKRISDGEIEELANVYNAQGELYIVMNKQLTKGPKS